MKNNTINIVIAIFLFIAVITTTLMSNDRTGVLGPTDSVVIAGSDGDITIKNNDGRLSWGDKKTSTVWSIGFMETGKALSQLLKAEHFIEDRDDLEEELLGTISETRSALEAVAEEAKNLEPDNPKRIEIRQQWERLYDEFQRLQKIGVNARSVLMAKQMQESYEEIVEAVNVVSERMNIDIVLRFIPPDGEFNQGNPDSTIMQIRLRTALRLPEGIDITNEVLAELGLDDE